MAFENRGQYYFSENPDGDFAVQKQPLGVSNSVQEATPTAGVLKKGVDVARSMLGFKAKEEMTPTLENFQHNPQTDEEFDILNDLLLGDLKERGIIDIIARETNVDPDSWVDSDRGHNTERERDPNGWQIDIYGPRFHYDMGAASRSSVEVYRYPENSLLIQLSTGEAQERKTVNIRYAKNSDMHIQGADLSTINLDQEGSRYLFQEHLRDAKANPYNSPVRSKGFLPPNTFQGRLRDSR